MSVSHKKSQGTAPAAVVSWALPMWKAVCHLHGTLPLLSQGCSAGAGLQQQRQELGRACFKSFHRGCGCYSWTNLMICPGTCSLSTTTKEAWERTMLLSRVLDYKPKMSFWIKKATEILKKSSEMKLWTKQDFWKCSSALLSHKPTQQLWRWVRGE